MMALVGNFEEETFTNFTVFESHSWKLSPRSLFGCAIFTYIVYDCVSIHESHETTHFLPVYESFLPEKFPHCGVFFILWTYALQVVNSGAKHVVFIRCLEDVDPCQLVHHMLTDIATTGVRKSRSTTRTHVHVHDGWVMLVGKSWKLEYPPQS